MKIDPIERHLFFEGIFLRYGYDFRQYAEASMDRRIVFLLSKYQLESPLQLLKACLDSDSVFRDVLGGLTITTTEFFRDPGFFRSIVDEIFPVLQTYPEIRIWSAGCSIGAEVLSLCILLREHSLLQKTQLYATDINPAALIKAKAGIFETDVIPGFNKGYVLAGGSKSPSDYYSTDYGFVQFDKTLLKNVTFLNHNMVTDDVFMEANLILCRNVLIYFSKELQGKVISLFARSLAFKGIIGLGSRESIKFSKSEKYLDQLVPDQNIFVQKVSSPR